MPPRSAAKSDLAGLDISRPQLWRDGAVESVFSRLRQEDPVHFCAESPFGPYWSVTRYDDIIEVASRPDLYSSSYRHGGAMLFGKHRSWFPMFVAMDGREHKSKRDTVAPAFTPSEMQRLAPVLKRRTEEVIDDLPVGEQFDWVSRVSIELTIQMLAILFDLPWEDRQRLIHWSEWASDLEAIVGPERKRERLDILWECAGYFLRLWQERGKRAPAQDLLSMMSHSEATRAMPPQELLGNLLLLIVGGNDTSRSTMSALPLVNRLWPEEWGKLAAYTALIPGGVQELIRWQSAVAHFRRTAVAECELAGRRIRPGQKVVAWNLSGNRDESVFDDADRFIADRANARRHLAFGFGVHRCVGARLAALQVATLVEVLLERRLRPVQSGNAQRSSSCFLRGYRSLEAKLIPE